MTVTTKLEVKWNGTDWTDETSYLYGYEGRVGYSTDDPTYLDAYTAQVGSLVCWLDNRDGHLTPDVAMGPGGGPTLAEVGRQVRLTLGGSIVFFGYVERLDVAGGVYGSQGVVLRSVDLVDLLARTPVSAAYALSKDVTTALSEIVAQAYSFTTDFEDIGDVLGNYAKFWRYPDTSCLDAIRDICQTRRGTFFVGRTGVARYLTRHDLQSVGEAASLVVTESKRVRWMNAGEDVDFALSGGKVSLIPPDTTGSLSVLYTAHTNFKLPTGETRTFNLMFRDPATGEHVAATSVTTPVATTDYVINSKSDGSGTDYTASGSITKVATPKVDRLVYAVTNNLSEDVYFTFLQVRGIPLFSYDEVVLEKAVSSPYRANSREFRMPLGADESFALDFLTWLVLTFDSPVMYAKSLALDGRDISAKSPYLIDVCSIIEISESQSDLSDVVHRIRQRHFYHYPRDENDPTSGIDVLIWHLEPLERVNGFILDDAVYGLLNGENGLLY